MWGDVLKCVLIGLASDTIAMFYMYWIRYIIEWIRDPLASRKEGAILCSVFSLATFVASMCKNQEYHQGLILGVKLRKVLVSSLYDKVGRLSTKGLASTNSGKLITLVSADILSVERFLALAPFVISKPILNLMVIVFFASTEHWSFSVSILFFYMLMNILSFAVAGKAKELKIKEGVANDTRVKLIADMITGIRTIKSYGWELRYEEMINQARAS